MNKSKGQHSVKFCQIYEGLENGLNYTILMSVQASNSEKFKFFLLQIFVCYIWQMSITLKNLWCI